MLRRSFGMLSKRQPLKFGAMHGFELVAVRPVEDLNLVTYEMTHTKTGAQYYHIDIDDSNNTFCIGFRTPAENNKGTSHVLEHTTLCGSRKYPVRDPFFMMMKRSLSNFMNAMTGADYTLYPFATTNRQDFRNLLDVYLDAVFHPLLREEDFRQEGHRVELEKADPSAPAGSIAERELVNNGVVYNEMRGVVSEPSRHFMQVLMRSMLPETHYVYVSGGYPPDILELTYEELVDFHRRHYNPSNSITFTYGNHHPEEHMAALDAYFSEFPKQEKVHVPTLKDSCRFNGSQVFKLDGPLNPMGNPKQQKRVAAAYGIPQESNKLEDVVALSVLDNLLSNGPSSPMFQSLIETHIGAKYAPMKGYAYYLSSPIMSYGVAGVNEDNPDSETEVREAVRGALEKVRREGFDKRRVQSVIFQEELHQRHRSADNGVNLCAGLCAMGLCRADNSPLDFINWLPHLKRLESDNAASLLPRISTQLLDNPHRAVISVSAKEGYLDKLQDELKRRDEKLNENATPEQKAEIGRKSEEWLKRVRAPQPADVLPSLKISDIPRKSFAEPLPQETQQSNVYTIAYPTNGLVYVHGLIPFAPRLCDAMRRGNLDAVNRDVPLVEDLLACTGAGKLSFKEQSVEIELVSSGFSFTSTLNESYKKKGRSVAGFKYSFYTTKEKLKEALDLLALTLIEPHVSPEDPVIASRALAKLKASCTNVIQSLQSHGNYIATVNAVSRVTSRGALRERWWGLDQSRHASRTLERLQGTPDQAKESITALMREYEAVARALPTSLPHGVMWATCEERHRAEVEALMTAFVAQFPQESCPRCTVHLDLPELDVSAGGSVVHEKLPIDTSFVGYVIPRDTLYWKHPDQAAVRIAAFMLSNEYLHRRVREEGGAYGSSCLATMCGEVGGISMSSYRDPSPESTIEAFSQGAEWLADPANVTQTRLDEAKLRLFASVDAPYAPDGFGVAYFLNDVRQEMKQSMRDALLATTVEDVVRMAKYFKPENASVCVLESDEE